MRKYTLILAVLTALSLYGQQRMGAIKAGMFFPQAVKGGGFDLGFEYGMKIDTNLDVALSLDWFKKEFTDKDYIGAVEAIGGDLTGDQYRNVGKTTIYDFPVMVSVTAKFPINRSLKWFALGGLGAEMLYASLKAYEEGVGSYDEKVLAFDFNWRLGGGVMYNLGQRSEVFGELAYHYSKPSFEDDNNIVTEYDMSGIMTRLGVRFSFR